MGENKTASGNFTKTPKPQTAAETRQNKSEPNDTRKHQKQDLEENQNPESSAKHRQREEGEGKKGVDPL